MRKKPFFRGALLITMNLCTKNKNSFLFLFAVNLLLITSTSFAQGEKDKLLTVKHMQKDLQYFYKTILKVHPNPYQVLSPERLDIKIQELAQNIDKPLSRTDFFIKIGIVNSYFDAHTQINPPHGFWSIAKLPFASIIMKDSIFYFANVPYLDSSICGAKINAIDHISCERLIILAKQYLTSERYLDNYVPSFATILAKNLFNKTDSTVIEYETADKKDSVIFSQEECAKMWKYVGNMTTGQKNGNYFDFRIYKKDSIAVIELNNFADEIIESQNLKYDQFLNNCFDSINSMGIKHLFIDLSANGGGSDMYGYKALEYLIKDSIYYLAKAIIKTSTTQKKYWHKVDLQIYHDYLRNAKNKKYFIEIFSWDKKKKSIDSIFQYKKNIYLIQSWQTASAALSVVSFMKSYKTGITIGTETLGGSSGYIGSLFFNMKYSKLHFTCSTKYYENIGANNESVQGHILPDVAYPINNPSKSFSLEQLKDMLKLIEQYKKNMTNKP